MRPTSFLFIVFACVAGAQTQDGISAPASRTVAMTADEAAFAITVAGTLDSTQQQVKEALQGAGLPNPTVVATGLGQGNSQWFDTGAQILYSATAAIAAGSAIDTAKRLETLRSKLPAPLQNLQYSVAFNPSEATVDAMRQVVLPQLMDDSRKLAQSLAAAAGVKLGPIRSISDSAGVMGYVNPSPPQFSVANFLVGIPPSLPSTAQYTFYLNVVFAAAP
jgi:hypothetical protein